MTIDQLKSPAELSVQGRAAFAVAFSEAKKAMEAGEVPVGAAIVYRGEVIVHARNRIIERKEPTAHAELLALNEASRLLKNERLPGCELYTTLEPCAMCSGALVLARIKGVYFLAVDEKLPAFRKIMELEGHNHYPDWAHYEMSEYPAGDLLRQFFKKKRLKA